MPEPPAQHATVVFGASAPSIEQLVAVARHGARVEFDPAYTERVRGSRALVDRFVAEARPVYGVTTGFGDNVAVVISPDQASRLQHNIVRSHAVAVGEPLAREHVRAIMAMMLVSLGKGHSGVRLELLEQVRAMLDRDIVPFAPGEGSVGYLAVEGHIALVVMGEGRARIGDGPLVDGAVALRQVDLEPLPLVAKEGLALLNGTAAVTALAVLAVHDAAQTAAAIDVASALAVEALKGTTRAFDRRYHLIKAHPQQRRVAALIERLLADSRIAAAHRDHRLQDVYSLRAIPQMHGAAHAFIAHARSVINDEIASSGDNPVIVPTDDGDGTAISGGNFDGSFVGIACDTLAIAVTSLAKASERRTDRMVNAHFSGMPAFLSRQPGLNSGYMIVQYTAAGLLGEMRVLATPASVDSVSTCANQEEPVSFAWNAAMKAVRIAGKLEWIAAIELLTGCQALEFQDVGDASSATRAVHALIRRDAPPADLDHAFYPDLAATVSKVRDGSITATALQAVNAAEQTIDGDALEHRHVANNNFIKG